MKNIIPDVSDDFKSGYEQALRDINIPVRPIMEDWDPTKCPRCKSNFYPDYEDCDDGYYSRPSYLERCPYCGQKLKWYLTD